MRVCAWFRVDSIRTSAHIPTVLPNTCFRPSLKCVAHRRKKRCRLPRFIAGTSPRDAQKNCEKIPRDRGVALFSHASKKIRCEFRIFWQFGDMTNVVVRKTCSKKVCGWKTFQTVLFWRRIEVRAVFSICAKNAISTTLFIYKKRSIFSSFLSK